MDVLDSAPVRLHLGCGQRYLDGYVNIDFPAIAHTIQRESVADVTMDIKTARMSAGSVAEVRLHHVFEHFPRAVACGLLASWTSWLQPRGIIHLETPDFKRTALSVFSPLSSQHRRHVGLRHIFGSNEAPWAVHLDGWTGRRLRDVMETFGLTVTSVARNSWHGTYNIEVTGRLEGAPLEKSQARERAHAYLRTFLVDGSETENSLLEVWMRDYDSQVEMAWCGALSEDISDWIDSRARG